LRFVKRFPKIRLKFLKNLSKICMEFCPNFVKVSPNLLRLCGEEEEDWWLNWCKKTCFLSRKGGAVREGLLKIFGLGGRHPLLNPYMGGGRQLRKVGRLRILELGRCKKNRDCAILILFPSRKCSESNRNRVLGLDSETQNQKKESEKGRGQKAKRTM
jgi:hypothetical protein